MACDTIVYEGQEYSREDFVGGVVNGNIYLPPNARASVDSIKLPGLEAKSADDLIADTHTRDFRVMPFKFSAHKIADGSKTITVRPGIYDAGTYKDTSTGALFNVVPQGSMYLASYLATTGMRKADFIKEFLGSEEAKKDYIKAFLNDSAPLNIYSIQKVQSADDVIPDMTDARFGKIYENRQAILSKVKSELRNTKEGPKKEAIRQRIANLEGQLDTLKNEEHQTLNTIVDMMSADMDAVEKILNSGADHSALEYAKSLLYNYANLMGVQFNPDMDLMDDEFRLKVMAFQSRNLKLAEDIQKQFFVLADDIVKRYKNGQGVLNINGLPIDTKDIGLYKKYLLSTNVSSNPIVQTLTRIITEAIRKLSMRFEAFKVDHHKLVKDLVAFQKKLGIKSDDHYEFMLQTNEEGTRTGNFVGKLSDAYSKAKSEAKGYHRLMFYANNHTFSINKAAADVREKALMEYYKNNFASNAELTEEDVARGETYEKKLDKLAYRFAHKRSPTLATAVLEKARTNPTHLQPADIEAFKYFEKHNGFGFQYINGVKEYPLEVIADAKWEDPKYNTIQAMSIDDPRRKFYEHFASKYEEGRNMLSDEDYYLKHNYIPEKTKDLGVGGDMRQWMANTISQTISQNIHGRDPITGEVIKKIPVYMVNDKISPDNKSYNLGSVLENFMREVINYDEKQAVEGDVNLLLSLLAEQKIPQTNPDGSTKVINGEVQYEKGMSNMYEQAKYRVDANLYDERQAKEGVSSIKVMGELARRELKALRVQMEALNLSLEDKSTAWELIASGSPYVGNDTDMAKFVELGLRAKTLKNSGGNVTGNKAINALLHYTSTKLLAGNIFGGVAEIIQGWSSFYTMSAGGRYFTDKEAGLAHKDWFAATNPGSAIRSKLQNLAKYFGAHVDRAEQENSKGNLVTKVAFGLWEFANKSTNVLFLNAMLRHERITDRDGVEHSLFNVMNCDAYGKFTVDENFDNPFYDENGELSKYALDLQLKYKEVLMDMRDRITFENPALWEKSSIGRILGQFKGTWLFNALYARFGEYQEANLQRGMDNRGFYRSFFRQFKLRKVKDEYGDEVLDWSTAGVMEMMGRVLKSFAQYSTIGRKLGVKPGDHSELDQANIRMFMREFGMIVSVTMLIMILSAGGGNDDKDSLRRYFINQLVRLQRDLGMYMDPGQMASVLKNPAPVVGSLADFFNIGTAAIQSTVFLDPYTHGAEPHLRIIHAINKTAPYVNQYDRTMSKLNKVMSYSGY